jgi:nicotinate-nucleotide adenylyltransferase
MIGIFGGTFDPIHFGHLRPALDVQQALGLKQVRFIPLAVAVHRDQPAAAARQRLAMVRAAVAGQPGFVVDDREIRRDGRSYTLDTLADLKRELPGTTLCLFVGDDAFNDFLSWHRPQEVLELAHLVVLQRPAAAQPRDPALRRLLASRLVSDSGQLHQRPAGLIFRQVVTQLDISATRIRNLLARNESPRFLLPDSVLDIIEEQGLYHAPGGADPF